MITELLLDLFFLILKTIVLIFPRYDGLPTAAESALDQVVSTIATFDVIFPIQTLFQVLTAVLFFESLVLLYKIVNWILNKVRGSG